MNKEWLKYLPKFLYDYLDGRHVFQKAIGNTGWLFADQLIRMFVGFFVIVWMARYLGPLEFGLFNYAVAFVTIFSAFVTLGLGSIVIRDIVSEPDKKDEILGCAFWLQLITACIIFPLVVLAVWFARPDDSTVRLMVYIISAGIFFQTIDVIDLWFRSQVASKFIVYSKGGAFLSANLAKIALIYMEAPLVAFAWVALGEIIVGSIGLVITYKYNGFSLSRWSCNKNRAVLLLKDSWPLLFGFISYMIYTRIDQVMLGSMLDDRSVGIYSVSTRINDIPLAFVLLITSSIYPTLVKSYGDDDREFYNIYSKVTEFYTALAVILFAAVFLFGEYFIVLLFGSSYLESAAILSIQIFGLIFVFNAGLSSTFYTVSSNQKILLTINLLSAFLNIALNYFLIPVYGTSGAAYATVITVLFSRLIMNSFFSEGRKIFFIQLKSFIFYTTLKRLVYRA